MASRFISPTIPKRIFRDLPARAAPAVPQDASRSPVPPERIRRMHLNESAFPPSPAAIDAMQQACEQVNRYPDPQWRDLAAAISARTGVPQSCVVMVNGSDEAVAIMGQVALEPGDEAIAALPSFPGYDHSAALQGAELAKVAVRADGAMDVNAMLGALTPRTRVLFCTTPNNPTGGLLEQSDVARLCQQLPDTVLLVLDEAYYEFGIQAGGADHLQILGKRDGPWAVLRTFSKAYGLAGIRVGYCLAGSEDLADACQHVRDVFNVNRVAQAGALAAWHDTRHRDWIVEQTARERERLAVRLEAIGCKPLPSASNFVAARAPKRAAEVISALEGYGIMVRPIPAPGYEDYIRITLGLPEDSDALIEALEQILSN